MSCLHFTRAHSILVDLVTKRKEKHHFTVYTYQFITFSTTVYSIENQYPRL